MYTPRPYNDARFLQSMHLPLSDVQNPAQNAADHIASLPIQTNAPDAPPAPPLPP